MSSPASYGYTIGAAFNLRTPFSSLLDVTTSYRDYKYLSDSLATLFSNYIVPQDFNSNNISEWIGKVVQFSQTTNGYFPPIFQPRLQATVVGDSPSIGARKIATSDISQAEFQAVLVQAEHDWQVARGEALPLNFGVAVRTLPAGELGETQVTSWDEQGHPTGLSIILSPDAAGLGWFVDPSPESNAAFERPLGPTSLLARPGSAAIGHYDLLTVLLHEIGHIEGFMPSNAGFERHVQSVGSSQEFVAPGLTASLVGFDQELDPSLYPGDVLSSTLAPGVRELPSMLDVQIIDASQLPPAVAPAPPQPVVSVPVATPIPAPEVPPTTPTTPTAPVGNAAPPITPPFGPTGAGTTVGAGTASPSHGHHATIQLHLKPSHGAHQRGHHPSLATPQHKGTTAHAARGPHAGLALRFSLSGIRAVGRH